MTFSAAKRLATRILREDPQCQLVGFRTYNPRGGYAIDLIDGHTGYSFTVNSPAEWRERVRAAEVMS